jgi:SAM-dependent methyltransferase
MKQNKEQDEDSASWDYAQVWKLFPIPAKPCTKELEFLEKQMKNKVNNSSNILILGTTNRYRSLANKLNIKSHVADFSRENFESLTEHSKEKFSNEEFTEIDWLEINDKNKFDFIVGHRAINVIGKPHIERLFTGMCKALKSGGVFFCRGNVKFSNHVDKLDIIRDKHTFKKDRKEKLFTYLEVELYIKCSDEDGYIDYPKCRELIRSWLDKRKITQEDYELIKPLISMSDDARFRTVERKEIVDAFEKSGFSKIELLFTGDEFAKNMPIIKLTK